jgi:mono/diheme cytochrome c family protein
MRTLLLVLLAFSAVSLGQEAKSVDPDWKVPERATQQQNPFRDQKELAAGGRKLFERNCVQCHGDEKHARKNNAPDLSARLSQQQTDGALFWRMSVGNTRKGMPSFGSLPEAQRWQLVMYIRSLESQKK